MLDYHLHLWPHSRARDAAAPRAAGRVLRAGPGGRRDRAGGDRAPVPLPPGRRAARRLLGRRAGAARAGRVDGRVLEVPRHRRPRRVRGVRPGGQGGRPARRHRPGGRLLRGPHGRRWPACLAGYPFDVLLGLGALGRAHGASTTSTTRCRWPSGRRATSTPAGRPTPRRSRSWPRPAPATCWPTPTSSRWRATCPTRPTSGGTASPRRPRRRAWRPRCRRRAGASRSGEQYPAAGLLERFVARGVPLTTASDAHRLEHVADRADDLRAVLARPASARCRGTGAPATPYPVAGVAAAPTGGDA